MSRPPQRVRISYTDRQAVRVPEKGTSLVSVYDTCAVDRYRSNALRSVRAAIRKAVPLRHDDPVDVVMLTAVLSSVAGTSYNLLVAAHAEDDAVAFAAARVAGDILHLLGGSAHVRAVAAMNASGIRAAVQDAPAVVAVPDLGAIAELQAQHGQRARRELGRVACSAFSDGTAVLAACASPSIRSTLDAQPWFVYHWTPQLDVSTDGQSEQTIDEARAARARHSESVTAQVSAFLQATADILPDAERVDVQPVEQAVAALAGIAGRILTGRSAELGIEARVRGQLLAIARISAFIAGRSMIAPADYDILVGMCLSALTNAEREVLQTAINSDGSGYAFTVADLVAEHRGDRRAYDTAIANLLACGVLRGVQLNDRDRTFTLASSTDALISMRPFELVLRTPRAHGPIGFVRGS